MGRSVVIFGSIPKSNFWRVFDLLFDLVILPYFSAISMAFYSVKCLIYIYCPPLSRKRGDIKSHSSVCLSVSPSVCPSVTKTLTLAITFALLQIELWYLACVLLVTRPFRWYHVVTLTVTFDLLQGQICCRAGDHNSLNLLVLFNFHFCKWEECLYKRFKCFRNFNEFSMYLFRWKRGGGLH